MNKFLGLALGCLILVACSPGGSSRRIPMATIPVLVQPQTSLVEYRDSLAVLPFGDTNDRFANNVASEIETNLNQVRQNNTLYFTLINRTKIFDVLRELRLTQSGLVDDQTASQIGRLVGAKALLVGDYTVGDFQDRNITEERTDYSNDKRVCKKYDAKNQCVSWEYRKYNVSCRTRQGTFTLRPKVVSVERGTVVYSKAIRQSTNTKFCEDQQTGGLATVSELVDGMLSTSVATISRDIAPYVVNEELPFIEVTTGMNEADAKTYADGLGFVLASLPRVERACAVWGSLYPRVSTFTILHALGVCAEVDGNLQLALDFYSKADVATTTPIAEISGALQRIKRKLGTK